MRRAMDLPPNNLRSISSQPHQHHPVQFVHQGHPHQTQPQQHHRQQSHVSMYQDCHEPDAPLGRSPPEWNSQSEDYDQGFTAHNAIKRFEDLLKMGRMTLSGPVFRERLQSAFETTIERTQDFTDSAYTSHEHREKMLLICDRTKQELNQLLRIAVSIEQEGSSTPTDDFESALVQTIRASNELKHQLQVTALDQADELFKLTDEIDVLNKLKSSALAGDRDRLEEYSDCFREHAERVQEVCRLLHHVSTNETLQLASKDRETCLCVYGAQLLNACERLSFHPSSKVARESVEVFLDLWLTLYSDVQQLSRDVSELCRERYSCFQTQAAARGHRPPKQVTIQEDPARPGCSSSSGEPMQQPSAAYGRNPRDMQGHPLALPPPGAPGPPYKPSNALDSEEQAKIEQTGLEMKAAASEADAETGKCPDPEDNDIVRRAKAMSTMAFSMYQFTRGEGDLKTTQDLFTQAEFFAEEANKFYKVVRVFTYQVPSGTLKKELLEHLAKVPAFVQQLQFSVKNSTVGKAATFTKVDSVIQETKNLMNFVSKTVTSCLTCSSKYNIEMLSRARSQSPSGRHGAEGDYDGESGMGSRGGSSSSDPNI